MKVEPKDLLDAYRRIDHTRETKGSIAERLEVSETTLYAYLRDRKALEPLAKQLVASQKKTAAQETPSGD